MQTNVPSGVNEQLSEREAWTKIPLALRTLMQFKAVVRENEKTSVTLFCQSYTDAGHSIDFHNVIMDNRQCFGQITVAYGYATMSSMGCGGGGCCWSVRPIETEEEIAWRDQPDWEDNNKSL